MNKKLPLSITHPDLAKEAVGWDPENVTFGSHRKLLWKCELGHLWEAKVSSRSNGTGCLICVGKQVLPGFNDLLTTHPELAKEAFDWDPSTVSRGSDKKRMWKCALGHLWEASISSRVRGRGCAVCRGLKIQVGFNDLASKNPMLAKEALGWDPQTVTAGAQQKKLWRCTSGHEWSATVASRNAGNGCPICAGQQILKGFNDLAFINPGLALEAVGWDPATVAPNSNLKKLWRCKLNHEWKATIASRNTGGGCPVCANKKIIKGFNDLLTIAPEIAVEAFGWDPTTVTIGSSKRMPWKCSLGHEWFTAISNRNRGDNCPTCSNRVLLKGFNDLAFKMPVLAKEAVGWDPSTVTLNSEVKKLWRCKLNHEWIATVKDRTGGAGCHFCANQKVLKGFNDFSSKMPELAKEAVGWDPSTVTASSGLKRLWQCQLGHQWEATVADRTSGKGCSICSGRTVLQGFNDLAFKNPALASQAKGWDPTKVSSGTHRKLLWKCELGHEWAASVASRNQGVGCPECASSGYKTSEPSWLYLLSHEKWAMLQVGITNSPQTRLKKHKRLGWELIELRGPMDGLIAKEWEASILLILKRQGAKLAREEVAGKFDGYTEAWLQNTFPVNSLRELMDRVLADEDNPNPHLMG